MYVTEGESDPGDRDGGEQTRPSTDTAAIDVAARFDLV